MRACPCGCERTCRIGLSRAARLFEQLDTALSRLAPLVDAARREPTVDGDFRTMACNRCRRGELVRDLLLDHLHERSTSPATPAIAELTRAATGLVTAIADLVDEGPGRGCHAGASAPGRVARG